MGGVHKLAPEYEELLRRHKRETKRRKVASPPARPEPDIVDLVSSEDEWDEVELDQSEDEGEEESFDEPSEEITVSLTPIPDSRPKKEALFSRKERLEIHTLTLMALILHSRTRNSWISSHKARKGLVNLLPTIVQQELHPPNHLSYNLKTKKLMDGLRAAIRIWKHKFNITCIGLYCVGWEEIGQAERAIAPVLTQDQFFARLEKRSGSVDLFTQGFCALLRANGLECRLVCSLQPPDFTSPGKSKQKPVTILNRPPIYWTEVWDPYSDQWISVEPCQGLVQVVRGKSLFEPNVTDSRNIMRYCIAWDMANRSRDVTRRYASEYNARTRKKRLPFAGTAWTTVSDKVLSRFSAKTLTKRDLEEIKQLNRREQTEGIPSRIQNFVGHPIYVLEHQLKKNEYLDPKTPCGRLALKDHKSCPIYLRKNVKQCLSARSWYRKGRVILPGEQPKLYRRSKNLMGEEEDVGLYSRDQTTDFVPEPVVDGVVPKSEYGTIDLFVSSMLPPNSAYIVESFGERAAKELGVDYARAIVGAEFERRSVKSVYKGVVVPAANEEAIKAVCLGLRELEIEKKEQEENMRLMSMWRRLIIGVRIWNRIELMNPETPSAKEVSEQSKALSEEHLPVESSETKPSAWDPGSDSDSEVKPSAWDPGSDSDSEVKPSAWDPGSDSDSDEPSAWDPGSDSDLDVTSTKDTDQIKLEVEPIEPISLDRNNEPSTNPTQDSGSNHCENISPVQPKTEKLQATQPRSKKICVDLNEVIHEVRAVPTVKPPAPAKSPVIESDSSDFPDVFLDDDED